MDFLQLFCYATAVIMPGLAFRSAWLIHGYNEGDAEIIFFSLYGWAAYMYCLTVFLKLCTVEEAINALAKVQVASYYLAAVIATGELTEFNRYLCAATGWASASAPLLTFLFSPEMTVAMLPHWALSLISTLYGAAWFARETDYIGASQYGVAAACSFILMLVVLHKAHSIIRR